MERQTTIKKLFYEEGIQFAIPSYQRAFSWEVKTDRKQIEQFITDINDQKIIKNKEEEKKRKKYFLGHFLFEKDKNVENKYWIIDGQQRLTTIVIFFSCLIRELEKREKLTSKILDIDDSELQIWRIKENYIRCQNVNKFETVAYDNPYFENVIFDNNNNITAVTASAKRILAAKEAFVDFLKNAELIQLLNWKKVIDDSVITTFEVSDKVQATQIFAFQNDRGKNLTTLEKLKAFLMHKIYSVCENENPEKVIQNIEIIFSDIYKQSERIKLDEDQVLSYHNIAFLTGWESPLKNVKDELLKIADIETWIKKFVVNLNETFLNIEEIETLAKTNTSIADVILLDSHNSMPLLIKLFHFHKSDLPLIDKLVRIMEHILFKLEYTLGNYRSNYLHGKAKEYKGNADLLSMNLEHWAKYGFKEYWNFNGDCKNYFNGSYHYHNNVRYVLWKYENHLRGQKRKPLIQPTDFLNKFGTKHLENTTDHITPRDPDFTTYTEEFKKDWLNNIGNLVLMAWGDNSAKRNYDPNKKIHLFDSDYYAHKEIRDVLVNKKQWSDQEIKARRDNIVIFILNNWNIK